MHIEVQTAQLSCSHFSNLGNDTQTGVEDIRSHLELMYDKLRVTVASMEGERRQRELIERVENHAKKYELARPTELERMLTRRRKIESYKETSERVKAERTQQVQAELQKREEARRAEEMKRLELENLESEKRRKQAEQVGSFFSYLNNFTFRTKFNERFDKINYERCKTLPFIKRLLRRKAKKCSKKWILMLYFVNSVNALIKIDKKHRRDFNNRKKLSITTFVHYILKR